jgi:cysteinyl-tRNA synthetase
MTIHLVDTRRQEKVELQPLAGPEVRIYSCGPTVYARQHIGNMRPYVVADTLKRVLLRFGYQPTHVVNITDVGHLTSDEDEGEDKMERAAAKTRTSAWEIAERYAAQYVADLASLGVAAPTRYCKATEHIAEQIDLVRALESKGITYATDDGVYFDTSKFPRYGTFSALARERRTQDRVVGASHKRNPRDFALWKLSRTARQMEWDSPWGRGFPGWHLECSAMAVKYLGAQFDIHTGGVDHIPVHHENETAQSECAFDVTPWVGYWLHTEWVELTRAGEDGDTKMSKSRGNVLYLDDLGARGVEPMAYRLFLLGAHYRQKVRFTWDAVHAAQRAYRHLQRLVAELPEGEGTLGAGSRGYGAQIDRALADDLNTSRVLATLFSALSDKALSPGEKREVVTQADAVLGIGLLGARTDLSLAAEVRALVDEREIARRDRAWARADEIRAELRRRGFAVEDSPEGPRVSRA